jgi:DNA-binding IscR family transcriptional regulator
VLGGAFEAAEDAMEQALSRTTLDSLVQGLLREAA